MTQKSLVPARRRTSWRATPHVRLHPWQHGLWTARRRRYALEVSLVRSGAVVARVFERMRSGGWGSIERQEWAAGTPVEVAQRWAELRADEHAKTRATFRALLGGTH